MPTIRHLASILNFAFVFNRYAQHYSADGFASASSATLDDDYFMEGVAIARLAADGTREHIFAAAVGIAYDTANTGFVRVSTLGRF